MKNEAKTVLQLLLLLSAGFTVCCGIYFLADNVFDGFFIAWFEERFLVEEAHYYPAEGYGEIMRSLDWGSLKPLLLGVLVFSSLFWLTVVFAFSKLAAKKAERHMVTDISRRLRVYMDGAAGALEVFPKSQAEIAAQMSGIKAALLQNEQTLKEETARRNDLVAYLAHDLKTPLTSVLGYLSLLDETADLPAEQRARYTRITLEKARRLEKMIHEFFEITRYNLQQMVVNKEPIDLYYMLVQLTDELRPVLAAGENTAVLKASEALSVTGDPDKLARVFSNVLKNAAAYSYPHTEILIEGEEKEGFVTLRFTNRGKTIPKEKLNALFEKFYRLDEARATGTGGAGLGLAIAREIVALHGGTISAASENETIVFTISLPVC